MIEVKISHCGSGMHYELCLDEKDSTDNLALGDLVCYLTDDEWYQVIYAFDAYQVAQETLKNAYKRKIDIITD